MNVNDLPNDVFDLIGSLSLANAEQRISDSLNYIKSNRAKKDMLNNLFIYSDSVWFDSCLGFHNVQEKIGYLGINQAKIDFYSSIEQLLSANYRSAYDSMRRMFEMSILQVYFSLDEIPLIKAEEWKKSKANSPGFSSMIDTIFKSSRFQKFEKQFRVADQIKKDYWKICNIVHVKGLCKSYAEFQGSSFSINDIPIKEVNPDGINEYFDYLFCIFKKIILVFTLNNPITLVGLPKEAKFGINGPVSGFLNINQTNIVKYFIDDVYTKYFVELIKNDDKIADLLSWFSSLEDVPNEKNYEETLKNIALNMFIKKHIY